ACRAWEPRIRTRRCCHPIASPSKQQGRRKDVETHSLFPAVLRPAPVSFEKVSAEEQVGHGATGQHQEPDEVGAGKRTVAKLLGSLDEPLSGAVADIEDCG